jgi:hypothetical protein
MLLPPEKMTVDQLERRCTFHESTAEAFERNNEPSMAKEFRELARKYQDELDRRKAAAKEERV